MSERRAIAAIGLGSNLGDREHMLARAITALERTSGVIVLRRSHWIETRPVGGPLGQGPFLNGAALIETTLAPRALLEAMLAIERHLGRERRERDGPRTIDLDLLDYAGISLEEAGLSLPHPRMGERHFVLEPLSQIAPDLWLVRHRTRVSARLAELAREQVDLAHGGLA